ncbi:MAG: glycoside hydrolase family 30 protein [Planctomycetota bacterium]
MAFSTWLRVLAGSCLLLASRAQGADAPVRWWLTTSNLQQKLTEQPPFAWTEGVADVSAGNVVLDVDDTKRYQAILGMGSSLEHSTCFNLSSLPATERSEVLVRLFHPDRGIGINLARVCIGTPDFTGEDWYSYDDVPGGEIDPELKHFSIERDRKYVLPILKEALGVNPSLLFFASPWSPPGWMKSTGDMIGGHLLPEHYDSYARYFVRFIQAYEGEGIPIHAVTVQNEPGVDRSQEKPRWRYPSCRYTAEQERDFIKGHLGPALQKAGLKTEIWTYDHNYNVAMTADGDDPGIAYPRAVLRDPQAAKFVSGVAFHGYAGEPAGMSEFHREFPHVPIHFTEGSVFGPQGGRRLVELLRNWASSYNGWVTMIDSEGNPNRGPFRASRTCVTLNRKTGQPEFHYDYYQYGQFFRFFRRGAERIDVSNGDKQIGAVAVSHSDGEIAVVVVNTDFTPRDVTLVWRKNHAKVQLPKRSVSTFTWSAKG